MYRSKRIRISAQVEAGFLKHIPDADGIGGIARIVSQHIAYGAGKSRGARDELRQFIQFFLPFVIPKKICVRRDVVNRTFDFQIKFFALLDQFAESTRKNVTPM